MDEPRRVEVEGLESATSVACGPRWTRVWGVGPEGGAVDAAWGEAEVEVEGAPVGRGSAEEGAEQS